MCLEGGSKDGRFFGESPTLILGLQLHLGTCVYETVIYLIYKEKRIEMYIHHVLVIVNYGVCLLTGEMMFYSAWAGIVEGTNCFLAPLVLMQRFDCPERPLKKYLLYKLNGLLLWLSFLILRVTSLICLLLSLWQDAREESELHYQRVMLPWRVGGVVTCVLLLLISSFWFVKITQGMLKGLGFFQPKKMRVA